jgi:hypothetical protein
MMENVNVRHGKREMDRMLKRRLTFGVVVKGRHA